MNYIVSLLVKAIYHTIVTTRDFSSPSVYNIWLRQPSVQHFLNIIKLPVRNDSWRHGDLATSGPQLLVRETGPAGGWVRREKGVGRTEAGYVRVC